MPMRFNGSGDTVWFTNTYLVSEHLINMRVHSNTNKFVRWHKVVPEAQRLECIMYHSEYVALLAGTEGVP